MRQVLPSIATFFLKKKRFVLLLHRCEAWFQKGALFTQAIGYSISCLFVLSCGALGIWVGRVPCSLTCMSNAVISGRGSCVSFAESVDRFCDHIHFSDSCLSSVFSKSFSRDPWVEPFVFANLSSFVAFVFARAYASVDRLLRNFLSCLLCKTFLHIRLVRVFIVVPGYEGTKSRQGNTNRLIL